MGRWSFSKKDCVEDCLVLDSKFLRREGYFDQPRNGILNWYRNEQKRASISIKNEWNYQYTEVTGLRLEYTSTNRFTDEKTESNYVISLSRDPCRFGGYRFYFICPLTKNGITCRRRTTKLYIASGYTYFGCRMCYNLTYRSVQEHDNRVSKLMKNPWVLEQMLNSPDWKDKLLALKASLLLDNEL